MKRWSFKEYFAVYEAIKQTSPLSLEEWHRVYLERAREKEAFNFKLCNSDNEKRAIVAALEYQIDMSRMLIKNYPPRHNAAKKEQRKIENWEKAREKLLASVAEK